MVKELGIVRVWCEDGRGWIVSIDGEIQPYEYDSEYYAWFSMGEKFGSRQEKIEFHDKLMRDLSITTS